MKSKNIIYIIEKQIIIFLQLVEFPKIYYDIKENVKVKI